MGMMEMIVFSVACFVAAGVATVAGFGASTVLVPVAAYFLDVKTAILFVAIFHLITNIFKLRLFFKTIDRKLFLYFGIPSIVFAFAGAALSNVLPALLLKNILAVFLIVFAIVSFFKPDLTVKPNNANAILGGSLSGLFAGLIGLGGALRGAFLVAFNLPKDVYIATSSAITLFVDLTRIPVYSSAQGQKEFNYALLLPAMIVVSYLGTTLGKKLLDKISQETSRKVIVIFLFLIGMTLLLGH